MQQFDFGLLVSLDWLLKTVSVQQAAKKMNISPPAMSHTLARLRSVLDDPLLVRAGQRMVLTPKAMELREPVGRLVAEGRALFSEQNEGGLRLMQRTFTIRASSTTAALFAAGILAEARQSMPFAELRFVPEGDESVGPLRDGSVDIEIGVQPDLAPEIKKELLLEEPFVVVRSQGHQLGRRHLTARQYIAEEHVVASRRGISRGPIDRLLAETGRTRKIPVIVPDMLTAIAVAGNTHLLATVPRSVSLWATTAMAVVACSLPLPTGPLSIYQSWHPRAERDRAHQLLRQCVAKVIKARWLP